MLGFSKQAFYKWARNPVTDREYFTVGGSPNLAQDSVLLLERPVSPRELAQLDRLAGREPGLQAVIDIGLLQPAVQARLRNPEFLRDLT